MPQYTRTQLLLDVNDSLKGQLGSTQMNRLVNRAVREAINEVDMYSMKRRVPLSIDGANQIPSETWGGVPATTPRASQLTEANRYEFHCPVDLKGDALVDVQRRYDKAAQYEITTPEEFQRRKFNFSSQCAIDTHSFLRKLLVSGINDISVAIIHNCDTYNGNGTWTASTDAQTVTTTVDNYVEGAGAVTFNTTIGATTAVMTNDGFTAVDLEAYVNNSVYLWIYIPAVTNLTSFTLKWGSSSANYYSRTVSKTHDGLSFQTGWNLLRFPWADATETGTVVDTAIDYLQLTITKTAGMLAATGWIIDRIAAQEDSLYEVVYYSDHPWQSSVGALLREATADGDYLNVDGVEYDLIVYKAMEIASAGPLKSDNDQGKNKSIFSQKAAAYLMDHPSERLIPTTLYEDIASTDEVDINTT